MIGRGTFGGEICREVSAPRRPTSREPKFARTAFDDISSCTPQKRRSRPEIDTDVVYCCKTVQKHNPDGTRTRSLYQTRCRKLGVSGASTGREQITYVARYPVCYQN